MHTRNPVTVSNSLRVLVKESRPLDLLHLLQTLVVREWMQPSTSMWLVSPWLSDTGILNNDSLAFAHLEPRWRRGWVGLAEVLASCVGRGTNVHIVTLPEVPMYRRRESERQTERFLNVLQIAARARPSGLKIHRDDAAQLHGKGWLTEHWYLGGSMNFTHAGVSLRTEFLHVYTDRGVLAQTRAEFEQRWGSSV